MTSLTLIKAAVIIICGPTAYRILLVLKPPLLCLEKGMRFLHSHKHWLFHLHAWSGHLYSCLRSFDNG